MSNIWFTSDTHGYHKNICKGSTSWDNDANQNNGQSCRDFKDQFEMTDKLVESINKYVKEDDILYHLGDWSFGGIDKIWELRKRINCKNIHLILGNHDHHIEDNKEYGVLKSNKDKLLNINILGDDINEDEEYYNFHLRKLFSSVNHVCTVGLREGSLFLSHYAHRVWNKSHHGRIHLYGHSHDSLDKHPNQPWGKSMDVGMDSAYRILGEYRPFHINEIMKIMNERDALIIDHHNKNTN